MVDGPYELAQLNISRMLAPLHDPIMADFVASLDPVNAAAERTAGFRWRLKTEDGNATAIRIDNDDWLIVNMSVWSTPEALLAYVYGADHRPVLRRRREWFDRLAEAATVLWWVPTGTRPTLVDARERLDHLRAHGPTSTAFTLRMTYPPPHVPGPSQRRDLEECGVD